MNKRKQSNDWLIILILLVIMILVALGVLIYQVVGYFSESDNPDLSLPPQTEIEVIPPDIQEEEPLPPPEEDEEPQEEEPEPTEEEEPEEEEEIPEEEEVIPDISAQGSFMSNTGSALNIVVDWMAYTDEAGDLCLRTDMSVLSYSLNVSVIYGGGNIVIGGESFTLDTASVAYDGNDQLKSLLCSQTVKLDTSNGIPPAVDIFAVWNYGGTYSGVEYINISASGTAVIA